MQIEESKKEYEANGSTVDSYVSLYLQYFLTLSEESKKKYEANGSTIDSYVTLYLQYFLTLSEESKMEYEVNASYSFFDSSICIRGQASCAESIFGYEFQKKFLKQL